MRAHSNTVAQHPSLGRYPRHYPLHFTFSCSVCLLSAWQPAPCPTRNFLRCAALLPLRFPLSSSSCGGAGGLYFKEHVTCGPSATAPAQPSCAAQSVPGGDSSGPTQPLKLGRLLFSDGGLVGMGCVAVATTPVLCCNCPSGEVSGVAVAPVLSHWLPLAEVTPFPPPARWGVSQHSAMRVGTGRSSAAASVTPVGRYCSMHASGWLATGAAAQTLLLHSKVMAAVVSSGPAAVRPCTNTKQKTVWCTQTQRTTPKKHPQKNLNPARSPGG